MGLTWCDEENVYGKNESFYKTEKRNIKRIG